MSITQTEKWVPAVDTFGARLAIVRHHLGMNVKEAADACGIPEANWRGWEKSGRTPRNIVTIADRIADRVGVDDYWLSTGRSPRQLAADGGFPVVHPPGLEPGTHWLTVGGRSSRGPKGRTDSTRPGGRSGR